MAQTRLEIELKFYVSDLAALRERLVAAGGTLVKPRVFERNVRFDSADQALKNQRSLLRLRQDGDVRLTYKGEPPAGTASAEVRVREELEISVSNFEIAELLLERIGFVPQQSYEKYRETFHLGEVEVVLDELPYGNFVELEGSEEAIRQSAELLQLDWSQRILTNYLTLLAYVNKFYGLAIQDLTFANFMGVSVSIPIILSATFTD